MTKKLTAIGANAAAILQEEQDRLAHKAYQLRAAGMDWWDIAERLEITRREARDAVATAMNEASRLVSDHSKSMLLMLEVSLRDQLIAAHAKAALEWTERVDKDGNTVTVPPDVRAGEFVLRAAGERAKLLGLDQADAAAATVRTVVIAGTSEEYIAALRLIAGGGEAELGAEAG